MLEIGDARSWAAARASGVVRLLMGAEADFVDVEGALAVEQFGYAAFMAQTMVIRCLSVISVQHGGEVQFDTSSVTFDCFAGVDQQVIDEAMALASEPLDFGTGEAHDEWLARLDAFRASVEATLDLAEPLPQLRSPDGMFPALVVAREWLGLCADLGVPVTPISDGDSNLTIT